MFLQNKLGRALFPKRHFGNAVTRFIEDPHGVFQRRVLSRVRENFDLQDGFHIDSYQDFRLVFQLIDFLIYGTCAFRHSRVRGNPVAC